VRSLNFANLLEKYELPRRVYLLNSIIIPIPDNDVEARFFLRRIGMETYFEILEGIEAENVEILSALGHESTVEVLKKLAPPHLEKHFFFNRVEIVFNKGEWALALKTKKRLEVREYEYNEIKEMLENNMIEFFVLIREE